MKRKGSVLDRVADVSELAIKDKINIFGLTGSGKTTLACDWPKPLLLIGVEDGTRSVHNIAGVKFVRLFESGELALLVDDAMKSRKYETVVLDTVTGFQQLILKEILGLDDIPLDIGWGTATRDQYGQRANQVKEHLRNLFRLAEYDISHTLVLGQEKVQDVDEDELRLAPHVMSELGASALGYLNADCDYIMQTFLRERTTTKKMTVGKGAKKKIVTKREVIMNTDGSPEVEYCLRTGPHPTYVTKFRAPKAHVPPSVVVDPSYEKVRKIIDG